MASIRSDGVTDNDAAVKAPAAATTYAGGLVTLIAGLTAIVSALIKLVHLPASPSAPQAAVVDGAFITAGFAILGFAWVVTADFRSRAVAQAALASAAPDATVKASSVKASSTTPAKTGAPAGFSVKILATGEVYPVLATRTVDEGNQFLINHYKGNKNFEWLAEHDVEFVAPAS